jgi:hypothetical protein
MAIADFGFSASLSNMLGNDLLKLISKIRKYPTTKLPLSWRTITRKYRDKGLHVQYSEKTIPYPEWWQMSEENSGVTIRAHDPLAQIAKQFMDPLIMFGHREHINFLYAPKVIHRARVDERVFSDLMSSPWAEHTEAEMLDRSTEAQKRATLLPIIVNSDGVALGQTNQQLTTALGSCGLFDPYLIRQPAAAFLIGYIPKVEVPKEDIICHLNQKVGISRSQAERAYFYFERCVDRFFWDIALDHVKKANKTGIYMRVLGKPNHVLLVYPYIVGHAGDEPGQKRLCGMYEGNTTHFCVHCMYSSRGGFYNRAIHTKRDPAVITALCNAAESGFLKKIRATNHKAYLTRVESDACKHLELLCIHPFRNSFHSVPMGYQNSLFVSSYDLLHTIEGGVMKYIMFATMNILDRISSSDNKFKYAKGIFNTRLRFFPKQPDCLTHVIPRSFAEGFIHVLSGKSAKQKGLSTNSMGRIRSHDYVTLLLYTYFIIGLDGKILPNSRNYNFRAKNKAAAANVGNVASIVLLSIELVLSVYFQSKRSEHSNETLAELRDSVRYLQAQLLILRNLNLSVLGLPHDAEDKSRKPHFLVHYDETISLFGSLVQFDTAHFETAHKFFTTGNWKTTSKRKASLNKEVMDNSVYRSFLADFTLARKIADNPDLQLSTPLSTEMEWYKMGGSIYHYRLIINKKKEALLQTGQRAVKPIQQLFQHSGLSPLPYFLTDLFEHVGVTINEIINNDVLIFFPQALSFKGAAESEFGNGHIYSACVYNNHYRCRHDFVGINYEYEREGETISAVAYGQVICFIETIRLSGSEYFAYVQYLEEDESHDGVFKRYKWKIANYVGSRAVFEKQIVDIECINGPVWMCPDFSSISSAIGGVKKRYQKDPSIKDRFFHVSRRFVDRSGWEEVVEIRPRSNVTETLDDFILAQQSVKPNPREPLPFDIMADFWNIAKEDNENNQDDVEVAINDDDEEYHRNHNNDRSDDDENDIDF